MERRIIKRYFPGLKPRAVKIDDAMSEYGRADDTALFFNRELHKSKQEVEDTLKHELIHYELRDSKREYHGHGSAFLKRAKQLHILGSIELSQCVGIEEAEQYPHTIEYVKTSLADFAAGIDNELAALKGLAAQLPINVRQQFYAKVRSIECNWRCYIGAIKNEEDHVVSEVWKHRKGPRGKPRDELIREANTLSEQFNQIREDWIAGNCQDRKLRKEMRVVQAKLDAIRDKLKRDYGIDV